MPDSSVAPGLITPFASVDHAPSDLLTGLACVAAAAFIWSRGRRLAGPFRRTCAGLAAFAAACGVACGLAAASSRGWVSGAFVFSPAVAAWAAALALLGLLPRLTAGRSAQQADELARLRLLEAAVSASGDGVMIARRTEGIAAGLTIVCANPAFERLTGYSVEEAYGRSPSMFRDVRAEPEVPSALRDALGGTEQVRIEVPSRRKDGTTMCAEWHVVPVADRDGRYTHAVAVLRDTTERERAERAVRQSEELFRGLFEQAADAIYILSPQGRILDANRQACKSLGYSHEELLGLDMADVETGSAAGEAETTTLESRHRRKDGGTFPVEVRMAVVEVGERVLRLAVARDVSRRRQTENALRAREEFLRAVLENVPCGVFWKDRDMVYLGCNARVARDAGRANPSELVGLKDEDLAYAAAEARFYQACDDRVMETGEPMLNVEEPQTRPDGEVAVLLTSKVPVRDATGNVVGVLGVYQDITDRKRLEEQLRQAQKLEAVGRLAGGIAHDFNNLLTVIRGNTELLRAAPTSRVIGGQFLDEVRLAADRAAALVRQLLMFSRRQPSRPEIVDLGGVVADLADLLRRLLGERVAVRTTATDRPVTTRADRSHLEQVVLNLAVNARDAMPDGGGLSIETAAVDGPEGRIARLVVTDTGVGMTPEVKAHMFEPFFTTKGPGEGTGLGLATVFGIVQDAGGRIEVDSAPGAGTTFRIDLPWCDGPVPSSAIPVPEHRSPQEPSGRGRSVLLVEDEDGVRNLARFTLEGHGYAVTEAEDGETALDRLAETGSFDLLVTDLTMPGMDGRELAERVREALPQVAIVLVSGYVPDAAHFDGVPGAVFLPKPFTPADLLAAAAKALGRPATSDRPHRREAESESLLVG